MSTTDIGLMALAFVCIAREQGFERSEVRQVETSEGFTQFTPIEFLDHGIWKRGGLTAIGENAKKPDGSYFTAYLVVGPDDKLVIKERSEIRHVVEARLPSEWHDFLRSGWRIIPCVPGSWECGCSYIWTQPRPVGPNQVYGCISHSNPKDSLTPRKK